MLTQFTHLPADNMFRRRLSSWVFYSLCTVAMLLLAIQAAPAQDNLAASPTNWIGVQGKAIEADFVRMTDDSVVLRLRTSGKEVNVRLSTLSLESHLQALKLADPEAFAKPMLQAPVKPVIEDFEPSFSVSSDELLKSPFASDPTIEQFLDTLTSEFERGNIFVAWHALPPKMQTDVETLMVRVMGAVKPQQMVQIRALMKSINKIVMEKKEFVLGHPSIARTPQAAELDADWHKLASLSNSITDESNWQTENFQQGQIIGWLAKLSAIFAPYSYEGIETIRKTQGADKLIRYTIKSQSADSAEVEWTFFATPAPQTVKFQKVGNIWLIPDMMNEMRKGVDLGLAQVGTNFDTAPLTVVLLTANAVAGSLERAQTQEEFNEAIEQLQSMIPSQPGGPGFSAAGGPMGASGGLGAPSEFDNPGALPGGKSSPGGPGGKGFGPPDELK